jgi:hypothetical protein
MMMSRPREVLKTSKKYQDFLVEPIQERQVMFQLKDI